MIKVCIWQHLLHSESQFIDELLGGGFDIPDKYSFEKIYDEDDEDDGSRLIFDLNEVDVDSLIESAKKLSVDFVQVDKLDQIEMLEIELFCSI